MAPAPKTMDRRQAQGRRCFWQGSKAPQQHRYGGAVGSVRNLRQCWGSPDRMPTLDYRTPLVTCNSTCSVLCLSHERSSRNIQVSRNDTGWGLKKVLLSGIIASGEER